MNLKTVKIIDYDIISSRNYITVKKGIKDLIDRDDGWQPYGPMLTNVVSNTTLVFSQAMAQYVPELWPED